MLQKFDEEIFPKILIIGQPFNETSGGGITITNLFKLWPKDKLYLATNTHRALKNDFSRCPNVYLLGKDEVSIPFLLRFFLKNNQSGVIFNTDNANKTIQTVNPSVIKKSSFLYKPLTFIVDLLNLKFLFFRIKTSEKFRLWLQNVQPDIIYSQLGHYEFNLFVYNLKKECDLPLVIHIMDDWPNKCAFGLASRYWQNKISDSFIKVLSVTDELITISEAMMDEYKKRYGMGSHFFHNPVKLPNISLERSNSKMQTLRIGYFGRVGISNLQSLKKMIGVVEKLSKEGHRINLDIYTSDYYALKINNSLKSISIFNSVPHQEIFSFYQKYDLLLLPLDFDSRSIDFIRFSFPTKASEYMASGSLILVFGPIESAVVSHAKKHKWAVLVDKNDSNILRDQLLSIFSNFDDFFEYRENAIKISNNEFNEETVCENFHSVFLNVYHCKHNVTIH